MLLRYSYDLEAEASAVDKGLEAAFSEGYVTADLAGSSGARSTREVGDYVAGFIEKTGDPARESSRR
jgi:isocitrate/isopropylmalate dehydrogenase